MLLNHCKKRTGGSSDVRRLKVKMKSRYSFGLVNLNPAVLSACRTPWAWSYSGRCLRPSR